MSLVLWFAAAGLIARLGAQLFLTALNLAAAQRNRRAIPEALRAVMSEADYCKSVDYTVAKGRFGYLEHTWDAVVLAMVLFTGFLGFAWENWCSAVGESPSAGAGFLIITMLGLSVVGLPLEWWGQFKLEQRFGFNRSTLGLWISDKLKGAVLSIALGFPLLWLLLKLVDWLGGWWWLIGWGVFVVFQIVMIVVYPRWILPLFNKLTPLPAGDLRDRLMAVAQRASFPTATIQVMDGSKRSGHSNAFFTGFGRFRRIVLFDTLIAQLDADELGAVLAHEIGHYKLGHIPRMLALSAVTTLGAFAVIGWMADTPGVFTAFDMATPSLAMAFLLFGLMIGIVSYWVSPLANALSRRHEYEADAFARALVGGSAPMIGALRKLSQKNLSNLTPHPLFSAFYYSHPTLLEREGALVSGEDVKR